MIDHNIVRLDITMHDTFAMTEVEGLTTLATNLQVVDQTYLQKLKDIVSDIVVDEFGVEGSEVGVVDILEDQGWRFALHKP